MPLKSPENSSDSPEIPQSRVVTRTCAYSNFNSTWITKSIRIDTAERTGFIPFETVSDWAKVGLIPFETVSDWAKEGLIPFETVSEWAKVGLIPFETISEWAKPEIPQARVVTCTALIQISIVHGLRNQLESTRLNVQGLIPFETVSEWAKVGLIPFETVSDWAKVGLIPFETVSDWAKVGA
ncbi:hypothetical protein TREMEDRAFT_66434 [Tremella mesenterica DSM 1558]|uniref:uncharacterized protein n=1 Tax=Tremella mesenterica (strain ATCC 24925 / CBS 8224 / DSM 1558 / NBRC 9311 / NRRL Y-6157 / RJB 2259-6 / UBC 559-6) TaxID=578456 RepID=UPI00032C8339|nr:uncharacterized protein TREMEDRAFT_66434 [Tremella mesenterica DSM 1558]EIW65604.1 hypothetical protein TREMEDRAFT_66434 [Tremella mesenterica DSM 1558]